MNVMAISTVRPSEAEQRILDQRSRKAGMRKPLVAPPSCRLAIKAIPNAPRDAIAGWLGDSLKVKVHAPALEGRANDALCEFLAEALGLPKRAVRLLQGEKSRQKLVAIEGLTLAQVRDRVGHSTG